MNINDDFYSILDKLKSELKCNYKKITYNEDNELYDNIEWDDTLVIPTKEEFNNKLKEIHLKYANKYMREQRNRLLDNSDKYIYITDWSFITEEKKQLWIEYRQKLRDLPNNNTPSFNENGYLTNIDWPIPPS
jgi:hypothetical protein